MNTSIQLVESQVIFNRIMGFKSKKYPQMCIQGEIVHGAVCMKCLVPVSKSLVQIYPQAGNMALYYLFDGGNMENIN